MKIPTKVARAESTFSQHLCRVLERRHTAKIKQHMAKVHDPDTSMLVRFFTVCQNLGTRQNKREFCRVSFVCRVRMANRQVCHVCCLPCVSLAGTRQRLFLPCVFILPCVAVVNTLFWGNNFLATSWSYSKKLFFGP